ncbi:hypothetical protein [Vitiosangium sp. GDMCC 1.1324]|uniref:hypothetical protein n=1 Tax=Vitiosangium sp. (strain GDMCC 1.1324) TaxID=2138576 RepID=UPI000D3769FD|nr:hypothetical protein [Vitiosangium sp. GDMCC 1.1324]PTL81907.1 hypothetical protein DAT35_18985 [Vitiosangium sp. GDMCC 1.1324]
MAERGESTLVRYLPKVLARSAGSTLHLVVAGSSALIAAAMHSWAVAALGGAAYAALVAWDVMSPGFWKETLSGRSEEEQKLPAPGRLEDPRIRDWVRAIHQAREELTRMLEGAPDGVMSHLGLALSSLGELELRAVRLVRRGEELSRYLRTVDPGAVREQVRQLGEQIRQARDAEAREQYESARRAREEHLTALMDIHAAHERVLANLSRIAATFQGLPAKVMRLRALDAQATDSMYGDLSEELGRMNGEIQAFEDTLQSLKEVRVAS